VLRAAVLSSVLMVSIVVGSCGRSGTSDTSGSLPPAQPSSLEPVPTVADPAEANLTLIILVEAPEGEPLPTFFIDGSPVSLGDLSYDEQASPHASTTVSVAVGPGSHVIEARYEDGTSDSTSIDVDDDDEVFVQASFWGSDRPDGGRTEFFVSLEPVGVG
jgi:hypothetical protein